MQQKYAILAPQDVISRIFGMVITHHGAESIKITFGDTVVAFNPVSKRSKLKQTKFGADIALISVHDDDMNGAELLSQGQKEPFVIDGPGEYGVKDILVKGFATESEYGGKKRTNTVFRVVLEGMTLVFLGALSTDVLPAQVRQAIDQIDVLFVPVGGEGVLTPEKAHSITVSLEPRILIPIHYNGVGRPGALEQFLKEEGSEQVDPVEKLVLKKRDLENHEGSVVVLAS